MDVAGIVLGLDQPSINHIFPVSKTKYVCALYFLVSLLVKLVSQVVLFSYFGLIWDWLTSQS